MNRRTRMSALFVLAGLVLALATGGVLAGTTGKVVGKVTDAKTGEGLPGANVVIVGTRMGAATDLDGSYVIINVPVGTYTVSATMIGFRTVSATGVRSIQDLTTRQDFKLDMAVIGMKELIVPGVRPLIEKSATTTTRITGAKEIEAMPVASPQDVVAATAGSVGSGNNIYIRGGRRDEVSYFVDGISINDQVVGGAGVNISKLAIQEVIVQTGGFSAEYGEALSGLVNVVTREGGDKLSGVLRVKSDQFLGPLSYHQNYYEGSAGGTFPRLKNFKYYLSGEVDLMDNWQPKFQMSNQIWERVPIPRNADGTVNRSALDTTWTLNNPNDPWWNRSTPWVWADTIPNPFFKADSDSVAIGAWERVKSRRIELNAHDGWKKVDKRWNSPNDRENYRLQGKLSYAFNPNMKLTLGVNRNRDQYMTFIPFNMSPAQEPISNAWKYRLDHDRAQIDKGLLASLTWRHQMGKKTFYTLSAARFEFSRWTGALYPAREKERNGAWWKDYQLYERNETVGHAQDRTDDNPYGWASSKLFFGGEGITRVWQRRYQAYWGFKGDFTRQAGRVGNLHEIRAGIEGKQYRIDRHNFTDPWQSSGFWDEYVKREPLTAATYVLDKMEFEGMVVNAGLRFDYLDANAFKMRDVLQQTARTAGDTVKVSAKYKLSPRLGISHPVSDRTVLHFSYGQFFQQPQLQYLYESVASNIQKPTWATSNQTLGDPDQNAQTTIQYETGFSQQLSADVAGDLTFYYKDIQAYSGLYMITDPNNIGVSVQEYQNIDYGNVRGFEATIQKRPGSGILSGKLSYSLSLARGTSSYGFNNYYELYYMKPKTNTEHFLDFDQRHTISNDLNLALPENFGPMVAHNRILRNVNINFLTTIGSGLPYTPLDSRLDRIGDVNSSRMPWTLRTDIRASKGLKILGLGAEIACEVANLFNRKNVVGVYGYTGSPTDNGQESTYPLNSFAQQKEFLYSPGDSTSSHPIPNQNYNKLQDRDHNGIVSPEEAWQTFLQAYRDYCWDGSNFDTPRQVRLQFGIKW